MSERTVDSWLTMTGDWWLIVCRHNRSGVVHFAEGFVSNGGWETAETTLIYNLIVNECVVSDLSVLIPARNEMFLKQTVEDVIRNLRADTEIIVVADGAWPIEPLDQHPRVQVVYLPTAIGQRAATNLAARLSTATYICKLDAHCAVDVGFDQKLIASAQELGRDVTQIPTQFNLHVFSRKCKACGVELYQGPMTVPCDQCHATAGFERVMVWNAKRRKTTAWRFDSDLHFQYFGELQRRQTGPYPETMSCLGACWFLDRERYWELGGLDEGHGSWGGMGTEIGCKSWLSGGRMVTNLTTWFSHMFRTQGHDFGFPYSLSGAEVDYARRYSQNLWRGNNWPQQVRPLRWLVEHFAPVPGWTQDAIDALPKELPHGVGGRQRRRGDDRVVLEDGHRLGLSTADGGVLHPGGDVSPEAVGSDREAHRASRVGSERRQAVSAGIVYYSDCLPNPAILEASRRTIEASGMPIVAVTLAPIRWPSARTIVHDAERGYLTMFRQILAGLEALDTDVAFLAEHDLLYHASHWQFTPPRDDVYFYNRNVWKVDAATGRALHYRCDQTSGLCANRQLLIAHYRTRVAQVEAHGYSRRNGFEPGTRSTKIGGFDDVPAAHWFSALPNIDIRHDTNLTPSRWTQDAFRNKKYCEGWTESDRVDGWGVTLGRMPALLAEVGAACVA